MRQAINFRLSSQAIFALTSLAKRQHVSKTEIVERALDIYAKRDQKSTHALLKCAGTLKEKEAEDLLQTIYSDRHTKTGEVNL